MVPSALTAPFLAPQLLPSSPDMCVVEAVCHMLLGSVSDAANALKQAERLAGKSGTDSRCAQLFYSIWLVSNSLQQGLQVQDGQNPHERALSSGPDTYPCVRTRCCRSEDPAVAAGALPASGDAYRFVVASSAGSEDDGLLPGLCMFTERWLAQVSHCSVARASATASQLAMDTVPLPFTRFAARRMRRAAFCADRCPAVRLPRRRSPSSVTRPATRRPPRRWCATLTTPGWRPC